MAIKRNVTNNDSISYEVIENCGTIAKRKGDWSLELRYMAWNGKEPRYDLRTWKETEDGERCGKGIGLTGEELIALGNFIQKMMEDDDEEEEGGVA